MEDVENLKQEIDKLREQLNMEISKESSATSEKVLRISRKLDNLILRYQTSLTSDNKEC